MPMDPAYEALELDIVQEHSGGRVWQEMAKNPALPGEGTLNPYPQGIPPRVVAHKKARTLERIDAEITQVLRLGKER